MEGFYHSWSSQEEIRSENRFHIPASKPPKGKQRDTLRRILIARKIYAGKSAHVFWCINNKFGCNALELKLVWSTSLGELSYVQCPQKSFRVKLFTPPKAQRFCTQISFTWELIKEYTLKPLILQERSPQWVIRIWQANEHRQKKI